ncbi:MAG: IS21 family transposase [Actinobacteria bacterium]|nr:IS21 family transposase [Actinomycetota bacterium]MCA1707355.1 IS21 family transposase [Actinomycetota bacterium]
MFRVQEWAEVHRLFHRENRSKADIADQLGMSRTTVYRLLALSEPPRYERERRPSLLDPHKAKIAELLALDAEAPASVIIDHLRREGYAGGITILKDYLQKVRCEFLLAHGRQRTTYLPGEIGHGDWWEPPLEVPVGKGRSRQVYGLVSTLPHCAAHAVVFSFHKSMPDFLEGLIGCLGRLGGVPEKLVLDNDSSVVEPRRPRTRASLHDEVAALFGHLRCLPVVLDPGKPESKGQVERTIGYFETSFLPLRSFTSLDDLQAQFDAWTTEIAFARHHRRVGARVSDALNVERGFLHALPDPLPATDSHLEVRVSKDCFIRVGDVDYSVPPQLVGRKVAVAMSSRELVVHLDGQEIAHHRRSYVPADVVLDPTHARALRLSREARRQLATGDVSVEVADLTRYDALIGARL